MTVKGGRLPDFNSHKQTVQTRQATALGTNENSKPSNVLFLTVSLFLSVDSECCEKLLCDIRNQCQLLFCKR
jgi:hypothetical protein